VRDDGADRVDLRFPFERDLVRNPLHACIDRNIKGTSPFNSFTVPSLDNQPHQCLRTGDGALEARGWQQGCGDGVKASARERLNLDFNGSRWELNLSGS